MRPNLIGGGGEKYSTCTYNARKSRSLCLNRKLRSDAISSLVGVAFPQHYSNNNNKILKNNVITCAATRDACLRCSHSLCTVSRTSQVPPPDVGLWRASSIWSRMTWLAVARRDDADDCHGAVPRSNPPGRQPRPWKTEHTRRRTRVPADTANSISQWDTCSPRSRVVAQRYAQCMWWVTVVLYEGFTVINRIKTTEVYRGS